MTLGDLWMTLGDLDLDSEKILYEKNFWLKNIFWDFENFWGWVTLDDLDLEPVKILCEKNFWVENFFWDFENFGG